MEKRGFDPQKIEKYFRSEFSDSDRSHIEEIFNDDEREKEIRKLMSRQFFEIFSKDDTDKKNLDHILYRINYEINATSAGIRSGKFKRIVMWSLRIASVVVLILSLIWGFKGHNNFKSARETWVEIKAPAWTRAQFSLPDGTTGWLNSSSCIKYNGIFTRDRQITLSGEAFFDVAEDEKRPFRIFTNEIVVKVLGTRFNIASYENEKNIEVVLEEGKLELNGKEESESFMMNPNDLVVYDKKLKSITTAVVQPEKYITWKEGKLVFRNDPVDVIVRRLERWYNIDVEVIGNLSEDIRLRATFVDESLEEVLYFLKRSLPIEYKIENGILNADGTYSKKKVTLTLLKI